MEPQNEPKPFGDYLPKECLSENDSQRIWLARQESVDRSVLIAELKQASEAERKSFLADVRAKAAIEHPLIASIYEASTESERCFFAYELLPGKNVRQLVASQKTFKALDFVHLLRRLCEANRYQESHGNATSPIGPGNIYIDSQDVIRIENLAVAGERNEQDSTRDVVAIGNFFQDLLDHNYPGTTRCLTLLAWMRGKEIEQPLSWKEVHHYCEQIEQQLTEPSDIKVPATAAVRPRKIKRKLWIFAALFVIVIVVLISLSSTGDKPQIATEKPGWIEIDGGGYTTQDGQKFSIQPFQISAHEVTIGEYARFLRDLELLSEDGSQGIYDHPQQPAEKPDHRPNDWKTLHYSAKRGESWNEREISLNTPVVGVDWWDAYAYSKWKRGFLPTQEQWLGALMAGTEDPSTIPVSEWLPVTDETPDRSSKGILGLAGSVSEWTAEPRPSPSNPFGAPQWIIIGGSYLSPAQAALTREWVDNRSIRRRDLGFRIGKELQ
jgi:hypothetical protein